MGGALHLPDVVYVQQQCQKVSCDFCITYGDLIVVAYCGNFVRLTMERAIWEMILLFGVLLYLANRACPQGTAAT